jgi:regulatory protein
MSFQSKGFPLDFAQAYNKASEYCAVQERCIVDVSLKMKSLQVDKSYFGKIIKKLQDEDFLDEERFAKSYVSGKFRINGWGKRKISAGLRSKSIPNTLIENALDTISDDEYIGTLENLINKKLRLLGDNSPQNRQKTAFYAISRGFEPALIMQILGEMEYM